ncbi:MAG: hypothetical protein PHI13_04480, partial [Methylococcales bacterium]|nr:hypothetical protein [Methylococcales bacterium]
MKYIPKRNNPMFMVAASGLLSMTIGATSAYATPEVAPEPSEVDINAKPEQYEPTPEPAKG